jgi:Predicted membrane protein
MEKIYQIFPQELFTFVLVTLFSLLIGLSQRKMSLKKEGEGIDKTFFGTDRTFTFIGILGYLLYILDPVNMFLFMGGGLALIILLGLNYYVKMSQHNIYGITSIITGLITYCLAPIVETQPSWFYIMVVVTVLLFTEMKSTFTEIAQHMQNDEMITLAKFLAISGIILPMLPNENLIPGINLTPYTIWLATVVVSGISYLSYLLKRYVFHQSGTLVAGIIGGLYSSTATISVLARKCKYAKEKEIPEYVAAMLMAVSMMYLRFLILIPVFSVEIFLSVYPYLLIMSFVSVIIAWIIHKKTDFTELTKDTEDDGEESNNPLEFKVALIFALLFVVFTVVTHYTFSYAGAEGLNILSFVSGLSDVTPFVLTLLQGTGSLAVSMAVACTLQAIVSNNLMKMCYALFFSGRRKEMLPYLTIGFTLIIVLNVALLIFFYLH